MTFRAEPAVTIELSAGISTYCRTNAGRMR